MALTIEEMLAAAELPEDSVQLCLRGSLVREYEELEVELRTASTVATSLGERAPASRLAERLEALRDEMLRYAVTIRMRALPPKPWRDYVATQPQVETADDPKGETFDERFHAWVCQMVSLVCFEPTMTAEQANALHLKLSNAQWRNVTNTAWALNDERQNVPFSAAASAMIANSEQSLRRPAHGVSRTRGGSAKSTAKSPRTNTRKAS